MQCLSLQKHRCPQKRQSTQVHRYITNAHKNICSFPVQPAIWDVVDAFILNSLGCDAYVFLIAEGSVRIKHEAVKCNIREC